MGPGMGLGEAGFGEGGGFPDGGLISVPPGDNGYTNLGL